MSVRVRPWAPNNTQKPLTTRLLSFSLLQNWRDKTGCAEPACRRQNNGRLWEKMWEEMHKCVLCKKLGARLNIWCTGDLSQLKRRDPENLLNRQLGNLPLVHPGRLENKRHPQFAHQRNGCLVFCRRIQVNRCSVIKVLA